LIIVRKTHAYLSPTAVTSDDV